MSPLKLCACVCLLLAAVHVKKNDAMVQPLEYLPNELRGYLDTCHSSGDLTQQSARLVFWTSINQFCSRFVQSKPDLSPQQTAYLRNAFNEAFSPFYPMTGRSPHGRVKRQALAARTRKEVRAMTVRERRRYFNAINALKRNTALPPNIYDFLANYHTGENIQTAHFGPAFPSWHRLYLWILEYFLRLEDPTVTIPYWASVLDNDMPDAAQSVIWSRRYFGNGDGEIRTGPFRNWARINPQTSFTRNVQGGELYTYEGINRILNQTRNRDILIPTARPNSNFETQHGAAHVFVGGSMNSLNSAARDPIFFSHHCFVDQIWQRFRDNQRNRGINPQTDYPFDASDPRFRPQHRPTANAGFAGLSGASTWTQNLGYINLFSNLVRYDPIPTCPRCADSRDLFCDRTATPPRCRSRTIRETRGIREDVGIGSTRGRVRRQTHMMVPQDSQDYCPRRTFINDVENKWFRTSSPISGPSTNTWAYIPFKVVCKRPVEYNEFVRYSLYNQGTNTQHGFKDELVRQGLQKRYENCEKYQDAVGKITIISHGLNYDGYSEEYVLMDNRLGVAEANGVLPIRMPTGSRPSEAIITAFDSCGRVCKPYCKKGSSGAMVTDSNFSGGIRVSNNQPRQFSNSYADALLNIWDVPSQSSCPSLNYDNIPVSFFCEYTDTWIWESATTMPSQTPVVQDQRSRISNPHGMGSSRQVGRVIGNIGSHNRNIGRGRDRTRGRSHRAGVPLRGSSELTHPRGRYNGRRRGNRRS